MKKVLLVILLAATVNGFAQDFELNNFEDNTVPASPTTAALGEYGFTPIDLSTGQINFSVPIYTIQGQSLSLPISFSYRAGVKIKETSAYTGHGWSMLAGGVITRSVIDKVDPKQRASDALANEGWSGEEAFDVSQGYLDAAPDMFNYNFMGYTGQFVLEDDLVTPYYFKEQRNWLIDIDFDDNREHSKITIVTEDGTKYIFASLERTEVDDEFQDYFDSGVVVAWHLTDIISAKSNESIKLFYYPENFRKPDLENRTLLINPSAQTHSILQEYHKKITHQSQKLNEIILKKGDAMVTKVAFEANTPRLDLEGNLNALSKISVFDYTNAQNPQSVKYFEVDIENVAASGNVDNERLFLRSIQEFSGDGSSSKPSYEFEYINENQLPARLAYNADHWGYYSTNGTEFPYSEKFNWRPALSKEPTPEAEYGSLRKVTFPTGGYNIFNYENNEYSTKNNEEDEDENSNYLTKELKLLWKDDEWTTYDSQSNTDIPTNNETHNFSLQEDQFMKLDMTLALGKGQYRDNNLLLEGEIFNPDIDNVREYKISIINIDSGEEVYSAYFEHTPGDNWAAFYIEADNFVSYKNPNQELYADDPNDIPLSLRSITLDYHQGFVLDQFYKSSNSFTPYADYKVAPENPSDTNGPFIYNEYEFTVGEKLDRSIFLDLEAGNYQASIVTSTIDNDMLNQSEASLKISYHSTDDIPDDGSVAIEDPMRKGGGIRIKSQVIGTEDSENILTYDYVIHDDNGVPTSQTSAQITTEPNIAEYAPNAFLVVNTPEFVTVGASTITVWLGRLFGLAPSPLWGIVGGDHASGFPNAVSERATYIKISGNRHIIKSEPNQISDSWIAYSEVKITNGEEHANTGFTLHKFHELGGGYLNYITTPSLDDNISTFGFIKYGGSDAIVKKGWPYNSHFEINSIYSKPKHILEYKFNGAGVSPTLIKQENYKYSGYVNETLLSSSYQALANMVFVGTTFLERSYSLLKSKETIIYDLQGNNPITNKVDYEYLEYPDQSTNLTRLLHNYPLKTTTTDSQGEKIIKKTKYRSNYIPSISAGPNSSINLQSLRDYNMLVPIEEQIWKGNDSDGYSLISGQLSIYDEVSSSSAVNKLFQPIKILNLETGPLGYNLDLVNNFNQRRYFNSVDWLDGENGYEYATNVNLDYYHTGNLKEISKADGTSSVYIWGYNDQYPIAKIEHFSASQATTIQTLITAAENAANADDDRTLDIINTNGSTAYQGKEGLLRQALNNIRNNAALSDAMITTYTYDPLIGITSMTDPKGYTMYYEYDSLNRLKQAKDADGKILSENEYHYKGQ